LNRYRTLSFWHGTVPDPLEPGPPLPGDTDVDVAIAGGGFTGLWTAYYLRKADPGLRIAVLEREIAGFGASGRNGGWCSALFPASLDKLARMSGRPAAIAMHRAMRATVDEVGAVVTAEGIDCHWRKGGTVQLARSRPQLGRAKDEVAHSRAFGFGEDDLRLLSAGEASGMLAAADVVGGTYTPHCAAIHPARLARGLAATIRRLGVALYEQTAVTSIEPRRARTPAGTVRAEYVIRATEGYTPGLPGLRRAIAPVYSLMIATKPLPQSTWDRIGLAQHATFGDHRHVIIYGQRTADGRFAFGGRGAPDWCASVGLDHGTGLGWAGGYVGDGVATANLAGRTLADLILRRDTTLVTLPWVNHRSRRWEAEPLRWLGTNAALWVMARADRVEARTGRPARSAGLCGRLMGG